MLVHAELIATAPPMLQGCHLGVGLGRRGQQEADTTCDQHVPDAMDVEVVLLCFHEGVQGHGGGGDQSSWEEEKHPALPGRRVAATPADGAHSLRDTHRKRPT